jgi:hypothetical protein
MPLYDDLYRPNGVGPPGLALALVLNVLIADRGASYLFRIAGLSGGERWSFSKTRRRY